MGVEKVIAKWNVLIQWIDTYREIKNQYLWIGANVMLLLLTVTYLVL